jgi:hypothetical protein
LAVRRRHLKAAPTTYHGAACIRNHNVSDPRSRKRGFKGHNSYGGATGTTQPVGNRVKKDKILHVMAYVRSLKK